MGPTTAKSVAIIKDDTLGPFKMMNVGVEPRHRRPGPLRRGSGRPQLAHRPALTSRPNLRNLDTGKTRTGTSKIVDQTSLPGLLANAVFANQDAVFDEWADGKARSDWTITGRRAGDVPFSVSRSNLWASQGDVTIEPAEDLAIAADSLVNNEFEKVTIDNVTFGSDMSTTFQQLHITKLEVMVAGGKYTSAKTVRVKAGTKLKVRVSTRPYRSTTTTVNTLGLVVPKSAKGKSGDLSVIGGIDLGR